MALTKLIYSSDFDPTVGIGAEIIENGSPLRKQASTIFGMDYDAMKPDDRHVGIHVVALGDAEHYGQNRNGDLFSKEACVKYHPTFVKYGCVFRHHRNKDAETQGIGEVKYAAYNEPMGRIELFIHADKEKAAPELERLEKEGEIPFSMACRVPNDRCTICGALRKHAGDDSECEHVRDHLGEQWEDGRKVGTFNDEPQFFDISFVGRPADRIAWNLKVATDLPLGSVKEAELAGISVPDDLACESESASRKLGYARDISSLHDSYRGYLSKQAAVVTARDGYLYAMRKVAASSLSDEAVSRLRELRTEDAMGVLARNGVLMNVPTFFKYATGDDYEKVMKPYMHSVEKQVPAVIDSAVKSSSASGLCNSTEFDARPGFSEEFVKIPDWLDSELKEAGCLSDPKRRAIESAGETVASTGVDNFSDMSLNISVTKKLAEAYAKYELSAIDAVLNCRSGSNSKLDVEAVASANNIQGTR